MFDLSQISTAGVYSLADIHACDAFEHFISRFGEQVGMQ